MEDISMETCYSSLRKMRLEPVVVVVAAYAFKPSTWEAEVGGSL